MRHGLTTLLALTLLTLLTACNKTDSTQARIQSAANLKAIGISMLVYASENHDRFPPDVSLLILENKIPPKALVSPRTGNPPAALTDTELATLQTQAQSAPWPNYKPMAEKLAGHIDYAFALEGLNGTPDASLILAWEKPNSLKDGINILFADGHVEFVSFPNLPQTFDQNNTTRQNAYPHPPSIKLENGLPVAP